MKNFFLTLFLALCCNQLVADGAFGQCMVYSNGTVITTWQAIDTSLNTTIIGAIGSTSTSPSTWTQTILSSGISDTGNTNVRLFSSANDDVVILWQYPDVNGNYFVAASLLPAGKTTWTSTTLSTSDFTVILSDQMASIDANGNILATWTARDNSSNAVQLFGATAVMGVGSTWSSQFQISN